MPVTPFHVIFEPTATHQGTLIQKKEKHKLVSGGAGRPWKVLSIVRTPGLEDTLV